MRRICGCDGYGVPQAKRSAIVFFLNLKIKDPESIAAKIMVEYNSRVVSQVHMQISAPWDRQFFFLNPRVQPRNMPKSRCRFLQPYLGNTPPST